MADLSPGFSLITPRTSRSSMSNNPNTSLPLMRRTSESSAQPLLTTPSAIPSFRAIRNLLPFGPSKPAQPSAQPKHPFHFASLRRSSDRKASTSSTRDCQHDRDEHPVISITRLESEPFDAHKRSYDITCATSVSDSFLPFSTATQSPIAIHEEIHTTVHLNPADLSTILEADNSGISKYIPSPSPSPPPTSSQTLFPSQDTFLPKMSLPPPSQATSVSSKDSPKDAFSPSTENSQTSCHPSPSTSKLDLSLSKLSAELHDALSPTNADGWLSAIVVEDADMSPPPLPDDGSDHGDITTALPQASDPDATFDFSALDSDLAELLSPHRQPASLVERSTTPLSQGSRSIDPPSRAPSSQSKRIPTASQPTTPLTPDVSDAPSSASRLPRGAVHSPELIPDSLTRPSLTPRPPSHLPRLMRSVTSAPPSTPARTPGTCAETGTRVQRRQPPSPLSAGLVSADAVTRSPSDTARMRTSSDKGVPRPPMDTTLTPRPSTDTGTMNARSVLKQRPTTQGHVFSRNGDFAPTGRATLAPVPTFPAPTSAATFSNTLTTSPSATTANENPTISTSISSPTTSTPHDPTHLRRRRHPHLFFSRKRSFSVDEPSSLSAHAERPGSSSSHRLNREGRFGLSLRNGDQKFGEKYAEDGEILRAGGRVDSYPGENKLASSPLTRGMLTPLARGPGPPTMEWLGPRTAKAFAAAGLFDGEREVSGARSSRERAGSASRFENEHEREREGATSAMSRFDRDRDHESLVGHFDRDRDQSTIHRYASLRDHAPSRAAFSEAASTSSLGTRSACTAGNNGAGWSPSPTFSSTPRTAFSGSTAPTSVSSGIGSGISTGAGVGMTGVNGTGPNGALRILQEKHYLETSALLSALADSQETCRKLREENGVLMERVRDLEAMMNQDRKDAGLGRDEPHEGDAFDKRHSDQDFDRFPRQHLTSLHVSPAHYARTLTPIPCRPHIQRSHSHLHTRQHSVSTKSSFDFTLRRSPSPSRRTDSRDPSPQKRQPQPPSLLSVQSPPSPQKRHIQKQRRASTTSSLFPAPPPEMSMLMLEDVGLYGAVSESPPSPGIVPSAGGKRLGHKHSHSHSMIPHSHPFYATQSSYAKQSGTFTPFASTGIVASSPSTATFSMTEVPGSPHSLQLRPEHELHLGDMTSLSLYAMSDGEAEEGDGGWKDGV